MSRPPTRTTRRRFDPVAAERFSDGVRPDENGHFQMAHAIGLVVGQAPEAREGAKPRSQ